MLMLNVTVRNFICIHYIHLTEFSTDFLRQFIKEYDLNKEILLFNVIMRNLIYFVINNFI